MIKHLHANVVLLTNLGLIADGSKKKSQRTKTECNEEKKVENLALTFYNDHLFAKELLIPFTLS